MPEAREAAMRISVTIDDELVKKAQGYTGITNKSALVREGLRSLVHREAGRRLAALGGSQPDLKPIPRRRSKPAKAGS
jgi:Arc/MetJ family transcription regulator